MSPDNLVVMGRVAVPFGVKGWARIQSFSEEIETLDAYDSWYLGRDGVWQSYAVLDVRLHGNGLVALFEGVEDRDAALALKGREIAIPRDWLPPAPENQYYWSDLIGLTVVNQQGIVLGEVAQLLEAGAHDVLVVRGERERLLPFVGQIVLDVDLAARRVLVDWQPDY